MALVRQAVTATGAGSWVNLDWLQSPFNVELTVALAGGATCTYSVEVTPDNVNSSVTPAIVTAVASGSTSSDTSWTHPMHFARINVSAINVGSGSVTFFVTQGMSAR